MVRVQTNERTLVVRDKRLCLMSSGDGEEECPYMIPLAGVLLFVSIVEAVAACLSGSWADEERRKLDAALQMQEELTARG